MVRAFLSLVRPSQTSKRLDRLLTELARQHAKAKLRRQLRLLTAQAHRPRLDDVDRLYIDAETIGAA